MALAAKIATSQMHLLTVGLEPDELRTLAPVFEQCRHTPMEMDINKLASGAISTATGESVDVKPDFIIVGEPRVNVSLDEVAQTVRMTFPNKPMFAVVRNRKHYHRKLLVKNGFTDAFLFPMEAGALRRAAYNALNKLTNGIVKSYRPVRMADVRPGTELPCNVAIYLPVNNKYVHFLNKGTVLSPQHFEKMRHHHITTLFVSIDDLEAFYAYALKGARARNAGAKLSMTERRHRLEDEARRVIGGIFRGEELVQIEDGQKTVEELNNLIRTYILDFPSSDIGQQLLGMVGEAEDSYTHAINVAVYGALASMALDIGNPAEVAMAGLLHDLGLVEMPEEVAIKQPSELTEHDMAHYKKHVEATIAIMQENKLTVTGPVMKAVFQHHEALDATGYPSNMIKAGIAKEAQLLSLVDKFDYSTRYVPGTPVLLAGELLERFRRQLLESGQTQIDPDLVTKFLALFPKGAI